ncbi:uncharacterized protein TRAVEDRAFT_51849 [Trametes versicolor FP-101664 SS1]|uniref:uncharacterized protein n=1 Tax=Trametes versicolor (strain FP-101664) TaxID=717944 RepID=UPI00046215C6|nr:uncharacterized protein TRAVEDRAFT_51849 [Trametes versicolor FP-101664 SS1]EIW54124.1 hypothetical protein TRAVEDRAFT_51849 [Trametes versicolor FP-101664 SS1]
MTEHSSLCQIAPAALLLFSFFAFFCVAIYRLAGWTYAKFHALDEEANKVDTQLHSLQEEGRVYITPGADLGARMEDIRARIERIRPACTVKFHPIWFFIPVGRPLHRELAALSADIAKLKADLEPETPDVCEKHSS